jgi:hypothetical protein
MLPPSIRKSAAKRAIQTNRDERSREGGDAVEVGDLAARIEDRDEKQSAEPAEQRHANDFERDEDASPGAAVRIGQMTFTSGTSGHQVGIWRHTIAQ